MEFDFKLDKRGHIKKRESFDLEFKQNFQEGDNLLKYIKTLVGMANNKGGQIIFGIQDKPHNPKGMSNTRFTEIDPAKIDRTIREYFSSELKWEMRILEFQGKEFGQITVKESSGKPIICKKNKDSIFREGAIYYRYRAETKEIEFPELNSLLNDQKEKERNLWLEHIQKIAKIGVGNVSLLDTYKGELSIGESKILLDKEVLRHLHFIQEGKFVEKDGEGLPTLRLIGNVEGIVEQGVIVPVDQIYPLFSKDIETSLNINSHEVQCLMWKLKVKGNKQFHSEIKSGKSSNSIHKYSSKVIELFKEKLLDTEYLKVIKAEYKKVQQQKAKAKK